MHKSFMVLVTLVLASPVLAQVDHKAEKEILRSYEKVVSALKKKDIKGIMSMMAPDIKIIEMGQTMNRAQFEANLKAQLPQIEFQKSKVTFSKLIVKGNVAATELTEAVQIKAKGPDGKLSLIDMKRNYKSEFQKIGTVWMMKSSESIGLPEILVNGKKPAPPKKP